MIIIWFYSECILRLYSIVYCTFDWYFLIFLLGEWWIFTDSSNHIASERPSGYSLAGCHRIESILPFSCRSMVDAPIFNTVRYYIIQMHSLCVSGVHGWPDRSIRHQKWNPLCSLSFVLPFVLWKLLRLKEYCMRTICSDWITRTNVIEAMPFQISEYLDEVFGTFYFLLNPTVLWTVRDLCDIRN